LLHQGIVRLALPTSGQIGVPDNDVRSFVQAGVGSHPPRLDSPETANRLVAWIRLRPLQPESLRGVAGANPALPDLSLSWLGINAVAVDQRQTIQGRVLLGQSSGQADQEISLPGQSVQAESLAIEVEASGGVFQPWQRIEDLALAARDAAVYSLDSEAGVIRFGDGLRGRIPEINSRIRVAQMRSGGGRAGNLPPGAEVEATIEIDQPLQWVDDGWQWRFPTTVAPRYLGADGRVADAQAVFEPRCVRRGRALHGCSRSGSVGFRVVLAPTLP
jgi:hypothetical protein